MFTGIVFTDGEVWKEHRRFTISCLRDFGMGKVRRSKLYHDFMMYRDCVFVVIASFDFVHFVFIVIVLF